MCPTAVCPGMWSIVCPITRVPVGVVDVGDCVHFLFPVEPSTNVDDIARAYVDDVSVPATKDVCRGGGGGVHWQVRADVRVLSCVATVHVLHSACWRVMSNIREGLVERGIDMPKRAEVLTCPSMQNSYRIDMQRLYSHVEFRRKKMTHEMHVNSPDPREDAMCTHARSSVHAAACYAHYVHLTRNTLVLCDGQHVQNARVAAYG
jgi:hypothetical protein